MSNILLVVESPAKAKTIQKYLGPGYEVRASVGHILDLPPNRMGVDLESGDFSAEYTPIRGKSKIIREIQTAAKKADTIYLAPDPDREGEAIAYHIAEIIREKTTQKQKKEGKPVIKRIRFHEITKKAILKAFDTPEELDSHLYDAQQARRILDRIVGYQISPILWKKVRRGLSAGRVQSVAVRLVADREKEIQVYKPREYWTIAIEYLLGNKKPLVLAKLDKIDGKKADISNEKDAKAIEDVLKNSNSKIGAVKKKERKRHPTPPFITSKLQQDAARRFRYTAKRTMSIAQTLYEGVELGDDGALGLITYMRTDSVRVSDDAIKNAREFIEGTYGRQYLPKSPIQYKGKGRAQDAHEAIRPTTTQWPPSRAKPYLTADQFKLYRLIWDRFIASQMESARFDQTQIEIVCDKYLLKAVGSKKEASPSRPSLFVTLLAN